MADGLARNSTLVNLDLSSNKVSGESMARWEEVVGACSLRRLDLSHNPLGDEGAIRLLRGLLEGRAKARKPPRMRELALRNVDMGDEAGLVLTQLASQNRKVQRVQIEGNAISYKYL